MFDNLLFQPASVQLAEDLKRGVLHNALLFSGNSASGKLTCALELARVLSCIERPAGEWQCNCASCQKNKALVSTSVLIAGSRSCFLEIAAAKKSFLDAVQTNASYISATRYLFIRSVRKLTLRFNPILWEGDDKASKIAPIVSGIDELLEELDPKRLLPDFARLEKICDSLQSQCSKLEDNFMYDSIPVSHIRKASSWSRYSSESGKKVFIIENADKMQESVRNALLKILEEPPEDTLFVLTTTRRNGVMPTILSRVRTYNFTDRSLDIHAEVIKRVFHSEVVEGTTVDAFLQSFLPVSPEIAKNIGKNFLCDIVKGCIPDIENIVKSCGGFEPRLLLNLFLQGITVALRDAAMGLPNAVLDISHPAYRIRWAEMASEATTVIHNCANHINIYNQSIMSALELLALDLSVIVKKYGGNLIL